jgi:hypothetical protein
MCLCVMCLGGVRFTYVLCYITRQHITHKHITHLFSPIPAEVLSNINKGICAKGDG